MRDEGERMRQDLRARTKQYALRVIGLYKALPRRDGVAEVLGKQLLRSATSVAAHYREGCRAKSNADFVSKLEGALQELEESGLWLELLVEGDVLSARRVQPLQDETNELISMFVTMTKNVKRQNRT